MSTRAPRTALPAALAVAVVVLGCGSSSDSDGLQESAAAPPEPTLTIPTSPVGPSVAVSRPNKGRLVRGVQLPESGTEHVTWDPIRKVVPDRPGRRWGTDRLLDVVLDVITRFRAAHPGDAPRVVIGDLSRPNGGSFGKQFGGLGHASHQNGLDADIYYPRLDRRKIAPRLPSQVDRVRAQELVDLFVDAGVQFAFVGTKVRLKGPKKVVQVIPYHNDHVHIRIFNPAVK